MRLRAFVRGVATKAASTLELVGCREFLIAYLLAPFPPETDIVKLLKTHHIDHIKPYVLFNPLVEADQRACFHYSNLQLLRGAENCTKSSKWNGRMNSYRQDERAA